MNNIDKQGTGGAIIKPPSARPSIHNHQGCVFAEGERMVRYGLPHNRHEHDQAEEQGIDEVDNILSKPAHPIRPLSNKKNGYRRNSLGTPNSSLELDDDVLSKSVPATLPSQLYYRVSDDEQENVIDEHLSNASFRSVDTPNRSNASRTSFTTNRIVPEQFSERDRLQTDKDSPSKVLLYLVGVLVVVCAVIYSSGYNIGHLSSVNANYDVFRFNTDLSSLGEKYNINEDSILQVQTGMSTILEREDTGSFMFVYDTDAKNFNPREFNGFINDISLAASKFLRNHSTPVTYTAVEGSKLDMSEHSELLCRYRESLAASGVLLVRRLEAVPARLAMAFHYYCDEYNPLVKKTAIFFTLNLASCPRRSDKKSLHSLIEKCLSKKWEDLPNDNIGPLLTRVVSVVIDVTSAF